MLGYVTWCERIKYMQFVKNCVFEIEVLYFIAKFTEDNVKNGRLKINQENNKKNIYLESKGCILYILAKSIAMSSKIAETDMISTNRNFSYGSIQYRINTEYRQ